MLSAKIAENSFCTRFIALIQRIHRNEYQRLRRSLQWSSKQAFEVCVYHGGPGY